MALPQGLNENLTVSDSLKHVQIASGKPQSVLQGTFMAKGIKYFIEWLIQKKSHYVEPNHGEKNVCGGGLISNKSLQVVLL